MPDIYPPPCTHSPDGLSLCDHCQSDYEDDPEAYLEFGEHPAGRENWQRLQEEIAADAATYTPPNYGPEIPL